MKKKNEAILKESKGVAVRATCGAAAAAVPAAWMLCLIGMFAFASAGRGYSAVISGLAALSLVSCWNDARDNVTRMRGEGLMEKGKPVRWYRGFTPQRFIKFDNPKPTRPACKEESLEPK